MTNREFICTNPFAPEIMAQKSKKKLNKKNSDENLMCKVDDAFNSSREQTKYNLKVL